MHGNDTASIGDGQLFKGPGGAWATARLLEGFKKTGTLSPESLRTNDVLRHEDWKHFDQVLLSEYLIRLRGIGDLIRLGLTTPVPNSMGKTFFQYEKDTEMGDADISLDGISQTGSDRSDIAADGLPLYILHKDFHINLRRLAASRNSGEPVDVTSVRKAGRRIAELAEYILFQGTAKKWAQKGVYGYTTHPDRNTGGFDGSTNWASASKTGASILTDVLTMKQTLEGDRCYGPYMIYVDTLASTKLDNDFKSYVSQTIRERVLAVDGIMGITVADQMPANTVVMVQMTKDVVELIEGEPLQTVQWEVSGGFRINFKGFQIQVPLLRSDSQSRSGIYHMS